MSWLKLLGETVLNSWWVILSVFIGGFIYDRASIQLKHEELRLKKTRISVTRTNYSCTRKTAVFTTASLPLE